ncbi:NERD domain-containing protein [Cylindrospermopsis curvispora]|uniref:NERD domain-containing protein n=1 Tax=Cylindrospermopsis curvispora GIHE-G1 TaxID=2666332 RepID=A0A7H0F5T4_9CYAN|nr:nuclease-related domain-containing protein [Cylindrospermopsis curvispora]QNP31400.1 NERD domain-containing protein [Cylindrospermopsis curvispora GIHE-G1]
MINKLIGKILHTSTKKQALTRLSIIATIATGIGGIIASNIHEDYWNKTIFRVQTVDFNILSHTLPTKLSYALIKRNSEEVQRTLNSNYSLFGLVLTDPTGKKIITYSGKNSSISRPWKAYLDPEKLKNHPFDVLLDPPPLFPERIYDDPHVTESTPTKLINNGRIIGRIYYVRIPKRTFKDDIIKWISNPFSSSGWIESYLVTIIAIIIVIILINLERTFVQEREQQLKEDNRRLQIDLAEKIQGRELQQAQIDSQRSQFEQESQELRNRINVLNQSIHQLQSESENRLSELQKRLSNTQLESQQNLDQQQKYEDRIQLLTRQLNEQKDNQSEELKHQISQAQFELNSLQIREDQYRQLVNDLQQQINQKDDQEQQLQSQVRDLQNSVNTYQEEEKRLQKQIEDSKSESENLATIIEQYKEEINRHDLNHFEKEIQKVLTKSFPNSRIETQFDVGENTDNYSKFTDFIVIFKRACVVIEAKSYKGMITPNESDAKNGRWVCKTKKRDVEILSCWGKNPYQQVKTYRDAIRNNKNLQIGSPNQVYGIVVFPSDSSIHEELIQMGLHYRVTTLNNLVATINQLNRQVK